MKIEISDNTFKYILNKVINSKKFQDELRRNIKHYAEDEFRYVVKKTYDRAFKDGVDSQSK